MLSTAPVWMSKCSPRYFMLIAEHSMCHPGRPAPERRRPRRLARLRRLPEHEVLDVLLLVLVVGDALAAARLRQVDLRELPVVRERRDPELDRAVGLVRVPALARASRSSRSSRGCARSRAGTRSARSTPSVAMSPEERLDVLLRELVERQAGLRRAADRLVVHVGQVHDLRDAQPVASRWRRRTSSKRNVRRLPMWTTL